MSKSHKSISKFLSYVLRHHPESIGIELDPQGWAHLPTLIKKAQQNGKSISRDIVEQIIEKADKQRFTISQDGKYIRAGYGHSVDVNLNLDPTPPPETLYHGTARHNVDSILEQGLQSQNRNMVHLSASRSDALNVGSRHGKPTLLTIQARAMYQAGHPFYQSDSEPGIWLVETVPPGFIET